MTYSKPERIRKIHDRLKLRGHSGAPTPELIKLCGTSRSQFMEDKAYMINTLFAPIEYNRKTKSYRYTSKFELSNNLMLTQKEFRQIQVAFETLTQFKELAAFKDFEGAFYKIQQSFKFEPSIQKKAFIHFEKIPTYKGTEHIEPILEALEYTQAVSFDYHSFRSDRKKHHIVEPYVIKEHTNRWYLIGRQIKYNSITTYALDRVKSDIKILNEYYDIPSSFNVMNHFKHTFGITKDNSKSYSLGFGIRLVHGLKNSKIKIEVKSTSPSGKTAIENYDFILINNEGDFIGTCAGDLCDLETIVAKDIKFEEPGEYTFEISHNESGPIIGVMALGLIIDEN